MVTGRLVEESDREPIALEGVDISAVDKSQLREDGCGQEGGTGIKGIWCNEEGHLHGQELTTKRNACVLSVLLYGAECWIPLRKHTWKLNTFHHRCIRIILGISNRQQWSEHITTSDVRRRWGDEETAAEKVRKRRLEWLGHVARMPDDRIPKTTLFSWLPQACPRCGPRRRWRDVIRRDLKDIGVE